MRQRLLSNSADCSWNSRANAAKSVVTSLRSEITAPGVGVLAGPPGQFRDLGTDLAAGCRKSSPADPVPGILVTGYDGILVWIAVEFSSNPDSEPGGGAQSGGESAAGSSRGGGTHPVGGDHRHRCTDLSGGKLLVGDLLPFLVLGWLLQSAVCCVGRSNHAVDDGKRAQNAQLHRSSRGIRTGGLGRDGAEAGPTATGCKVGYVLRCDKERLRGRSRLPELGYDHESP